MTNCLPKAKGQPSESGGSLQYWRQRFPDIAELRQENPSRNRQFTVTLKGRIMLPEIREGKREVPMVEGRKVSNRAAKQSNNRYSRGILIFLFFWYIVGPVISGLIHSVAGIVGITNFYRGPEPWMNTAGSLTGAVVGVFFAVKRIKSNIPWKMTAYRRALLFGCFYFVFQQIWLVFLFGIGDLGSPSKILTSLLTALDYVIRFPSAIFIEGYWTLLVNSAVWAAGFSLILKMLEKKKSGRLPTRDN
jgi:hypothetical protein